MHYCVVSHPLNYNFNFIKLDTKSDRNKSRQTDRITPNTSFKLNLKHCAKRKKQKENFEVKVENKLN